MPKNNKRRDPLPQSFKTIDEFVAFWDKHSTADYPEAFREIRGKVHLRRRRYYRVALDAQVGARLDKEARAKGMTLDALVNELLEKELHRAA